MLANVSLGTVDRVLHARGRVSAESKKRVELVLKEHNYQPNLFARSLSSKRKYRLGCLLPKHAQGEYWELVEQGVYRAQAELSDHHVGIEFVYFNQYDNVTFEAAGKDILDRKLDGVLISPLFKKEALVLVEQLKSQGVPCVFIDSNLESVSGVAYFGQHSFQGGLVAANLMTNHIKEVSTILACKLHKSKVVESNQVENRMLGFTSYFKSFHPDYKVVAVDLFTDDLNKSNKILRDAFKECTNVRGMVTFNSRVFFLADYLQKNKISNICLLGYDLLESNVAYLRSNVITGLIAQRPNQQGYLAIKALSDMLMRGTMPLGSHYLPIDILNKYNIDYYYSSF